MGLFTPAWNSNDPEKRMKAVKEITQIEKLQKIAEKSKYEDVQQEAWRRIAFEATEWRTCDEAVKKITNQEFLKEIAIRHTSQDACTTAFNRMRDVNKIAEIMMQATNQIAIKAFNKLAPGLDEGFFAAIAEKAQSPDVCMAAAERITSAVVLEKIVTSVNDNEKIYEEAARYYKQMGLSVISKNEFLRKADKYKYKNEVRLVAVKKMGNQAVLKKVILEDSNAPVRKAAIWNIIDQPFLIDIAINDNDIDICDTAVGRITDQLALKDIALKAKKKTGITAIKRVAEQAFLKEVAVNAKDSEIREMAVERLDDQAVLKEIALKDSDSNVCKAAMQKLTAKPILMEIAEGAVNIDARIAATERISDEAMLENILQHTNDRRVRAAALAKLDCGYQKQIDISNIDLWDMTVAYGKTIFCNKELYNILNDRDYSDKRDVEKFQKILLLLKADKRAASIFWKLVSQKAKNIKIDYRVKPHKHTDYHYSDCGGHDDNATHYDRVEHVVFPPYPFNE